MPGRLNAPGRLVSWGQIGGASVDNFLLFIDRLSAGVGKAFGWCIVIMTLGTCYDVLCGTVSRSDQLGFRRKLFYVWRAIHDGGRLYAIAQRSCAWRLRL